MKKIELADSQETISPAASRDRILVVRRPLSIFSLRDRHVFAPESNPMARAGLRRLEPTEGRGVARKGAPGLACRVR